MKRALFSTLRRICFERVPDTERGKQGALHVRYPESSQEGSGQEVPLCAGQASMKLYYVKATKWLSTASPFRHFDHTPMFVAAGADAIHLSQAVSTIMPGNTSRCAL